MENSITAKLVHKLTPGMGMCSKLSTYEDRVALVELFKKFNLQMSNGVKNDFKSSLKILSLYITYHKELYFSMGSKNINIHMSLKQWEDFFEITKFIDNSSETSDTFLDNQIKQLELIKQSYENTKV